MTRVAAIDLGTNATRLLVADVDGGARLGRAHRDRGAGGFDHGADPPEVAPQAEPTRADQHGRGDD